MEQQTTNEKKSKNNNHHDASDKKWISRAFIVLLADIIATAGSFFMALLFRFDYNYNSIPEEYLTMYVWLIPLWCLFTVVVFYIFRLYHSIWSFVSIEEAISVVLAYLVLSPLYVISSLILHMRMPIAFYVFGALGALVCHVGIRFAYRIIRKYTGKVEAKTRNHAEEVVQKVMIIGGGNTGSILIKELQNNIKANQVPVCIIDDNSNKWGRTLYGVPIVGGKNDLISKAAEYDVDTIIYAIPSASGTTRKQYLDIAKETGCKLRTVPGISQITTGEVSISQVKDVELTDLLGRDPITVDNEAVFNMLTGKTIMVTGGGGSIGSELCRQIASHNPKQLIIFDIYENNAYEIQQELLRKYKSQGLNLVTLIGSVRNTHRINSVMQEYKPDIVFHAAAHKHVPLMEDSPNEAIKNNVMGTYKTAKAAADAGVKKFVLISTDKAVNPTNIMGATKRICEMIIQMMERQTPGTSYVAVRFGNVLGSNGSVIPLFKKQIAEGGPVTVTHKDITRFFMTIPEAVSLVLQASYYAQGGEIFVLDMGEPVKIDDMARNLIKLSGLRPDVDIKVEYTGLRPGEKLYEEKLMAEEGMKTTENKLIFIGKPIDMDDVEFKKKLAKLDDDSKEDDKNIRQYVMDIVPTYHPAKFD
jgi:FlaA1/EpsC-like NDP-sugar epimerase